MAKAKDARALIVRKFVQQVQDCANGMQCPDCGCLVAAPPDCVDGAQRDAATGAGRRSKGAGWDRLGLGDALGPEHPYADLDQDELAEKLKLCHELEERQKVWDEEQREQGDEKRQMEEQIKITSKSKSKSKTINYNLKEDPL